MLAIKKQYNSSVGVTAATASFMNSKHVYSQTCQSTSISLCSEGCWNPTGLTDSQGYRSCAAVGKGFYSPQDDDKRYSCEPGSFADENHSASCKACEAGTFSNVIGRTTVCQYCPSSFYSNAAGSMSCDKCNPQYYDGLGSDFAIVLSSASGGDELYCIPPLYVPETTSTSSPTSVSVVSSRTHPGPVITTHGKSTTAPATTTESFTASPTVLQNPDKPTTTGSTNATVENNGQSSANERPSHRFFPLLFAVIALGALGTASFLIFSLIRSSRKAGREKSISVSDVMCVSDKKHQKVVVDASVAETAGASTIATRLSKKYTTKNIYDENEQDVDDSNISDDDYSSNAIYLNERELRAMQCATGLDFGYDKNAIDEPSVAVGSVWSMPAMRVDDNELTAA